MVQTVFFEKARICAVEHKITRGSVTSKIKVVASFNAKVATALNAKWVLFDKEQLVKDGFKSVELDSELQGIKVRFEAAGVAAIELTSECAQAFKVMRQGDGKKKTKRLLVSFRIQHAGSPFELLEHLIRVGGTDGSLTITPLQKELPFEPPKKSVVDRKTVAAGVN